MLKTSTFFAVVAALMLSLFYVTLTSADSTPNLTQGDLIGWTTRRNVLPAHGRIVMPINVARSGICDSQAAIDYLTDATIDTDGLTLRVIEASRDRVNGAWCLLTVEEVVTPGHGVGDTVINARADFHFVSTRHSGEFVKAGKTLLGDKLCGPKGQKCHFVSTTATNVFVEASVCKALSTAPSQNVKFEGSSTIVKVDRVTSTDAFCVLEFDYAPLTLPTIGTYVLVQR